MIGTYWAVPYVSLVEVCISLETSFSKEALSSIETSNELSNDLKEFGVDSDEPDLFNSDNQSLSSEDLLGSDNDQDEEDDLEIPAFLRRQKN